MQSVGNRCDFAPIEGNAYEVGETSPPIQGSAKARRDGQCVVQLDNSNYALLLALIRSRIRGVNINSIANPIFPPGTTMQFGRDMNELWIIARR